MGKTWNEACPLCGTVTILNENGICKKCESQTKMLSSNEDRDRTLSIKVNVIDKYDISR